MSSLEVVVYIKVITNARELINENEIFPYSKHFLTNKNIKKKEEDTMYFFRNVTISDFPLIQ
jgi:hypothetical protein